MMHKFFFYFFLIHVLLISNVLTAQNASLDQAFQMLEDRGEIYFVVPLKQDFPYKEQIHQLSELVSISHFNETTVYAYAGISSFPRFLESGYTFTLLTPPSMLHQPLMLDSKEALQRNDWDYYPTYQAYVDLMYQFEEDYPGLCEVVNIGTLNSQHELLFIHINDSLGVEQSEPEFMYTSSMHGDELTGFPASLHLIDHLLQNYGVDERLTYIVKNMDIWINPLANPDGTYKGGDNTVFGATRANGSGINLNRNYPDPRTGPHPDGNDYAEETVFFMDFADEHNFVMSANFHGGAEVCNFPWDTWYKRHPDDDWWIYVCRQFADTAQENSPNGYLTDLDNGITNGYDWYSITGGRQDYMNYFKQCREVTLEVSSVKLPPASQIPDFWEYLHRSMINYMEQVFYGVNGTVTDAVTGEAVRALVFAEGHDADGSFVYSNLPKGKYYRPIKSGSYDLTFSADGYYSKTIENVQVEDMGATILDVELDPVIILSSNFYASQTIASPGIALDFFDASSGENIVEWEWTFYGAEPSSSTQKNPVGITYAQTGKYTVELKVTDNLGFSNTMTKENYITVTDEYRMADTLIYLCEGLFFDTGGEADNYEDNEEHTMTFISFLESGQLRATFMEFDLEEDENCEKDYLEIFDGKNVEAPLLGVYCGTDNPGNIIASNIDGALTFRFHSNSSINKAGWMAEISCDTGVGISSHLRKEDFSIYPNPAKSWVQVDASFTIDQISIFNLTGERILQIKGEGKTSKLNIGQLSAGIYILQINSSQRSLTKKLLIQ